ncbi:MAG: beta-ketoacyl synthase [Bacteroidia bacterium]|nr:beta-ketoacyl synthase [Bacteroidia bacterium]
MYIGAENIISPLGSTAEENFGALSKNSSGIKKTEAAGFDKKSIFFSRFAENTNDFSFDALLKNCLKNVRSKISPDIFSSEKTLLILSTTKGDIKSENVNPIGKSVSELQNSFELKHAPIVVSNACASGVIAINTAANFIRAGVYETIIVAGCDVISDFVTYGFECLFAISDKPCAPFDKNRTGITLGEGCAAVVLSSHKTIFNVEPMRFIEGTSGNDANHISGPSRTGEGLYRTVKKTLELAGITEKDIDFISAHGTATVFNDDMESVAFDRLNMQHIPLNSLKGYYGHTLGAAGIIETAICLQSMRNNTLIKSMGFEEEGTVKKINIISENKKLSLETVLKTSSGFGGVNASLLLKKS